MENDDGLPHDELNLVQDGARYGWPYCYDDGKPSPEYPAAQCADFRAPLVLLPAHAAPLGMTYYCGSPVAAGVPGHVVQEIQRAGRKPVALIVTYHGYRATGHRVVAFQIDAIGVPHRRATANWYGAGMRAMGARWVRRPTSRSAPTARSTSPRTATAPYCGSRRDNNNGGGASVFSCGQGCARHRRVARAGLGHGAVAGQGRCHGADQRAR